jgi:hypothetical protein
VEGVAPAGGKAYNRKGCVMGRRFIQLAGADDNPALTISGIIRPLRSFNALRRRLFMP